MTVDLAERARARGVPGATLAVLADGQVRTEAAGVLNVETGVEATPDSLFQTGSVTKSYTATVIMGLAEEGKLDLDAPVVDVLPEFRVADPEVTWTVTPRHLLSHTSGIAGEFFEDTGRGDDALERYVERVADLGQDLPLGVTMSYCNTGYVVLGRIIERLTDQVWDAAMRELLLEPLGVKRTVTFPEELVRFRAAWGHLDEPGEEPKPVPAWDVSRSLGPAGGIWATAEDVLTFARFHLEHDRPEMRRVHVDVPDRWSTGAHWGLGWIVDDWNGQELYGHDGNTTGQAAHLRIEPERGVAVVLMTNGGDGRGLWEDVAGALFRELCGIEMPSFPAPAPDAALDGAGIIGRYERHGVRVEIAPHDGALRATATIIEPLASQMPDESREPSISEVRPSTEGGGVYVHRSEGDDTWWPLVVFDAGGERYLHTAARAQRRVE
jgi:CubicO group peptidase (beta-lactamase class C family)